MITRRTTEQAIQYARKYEMEITFDPKANKFVDQYGNILTTTCCNNALLPMWTGAHQLAVTTCDICGTYHAPNQ